MSWRILVSLLLVSSSLANGLVDRCHMSQQRRVATIGAVVDLASRVGKEQEIAMDLAIHDLFRTSSCLTVNLDLKDSEGKSAKSTSAAINLLNDKNIKVIIGTLTMQEVALVSEVGIQNTDLTILSLTSTAIKPSAASLHQANFIQVANDIAIHMQCLAALVGHFQWRKVTVLYEHSAVFLFRKAKEMGMMGKGYVWIVTDEIASLLDSVDTSVKYSMQGVIAIKTNFVETTESFMKFKTKFRKLYGERYPEEEETSSPSIFALRTYDTMEAIALTMKASPSNDSSQEIVSTKLQGLSGMMEFKNGMLSQPPTFQIINVHGRSYSEIAFWSPRYCFSDNTNKINKHLNMKERTDHNYVQVLSPINWPGGLQAPPKGWTIVDEERPLKIGIPSRGAFNQFVKVTYDRYTNQTHISGFSTDMFEAAVKNLPYQLPYVFVPFNGSYDELVEQVYYKDFDAAVGDIEVVAHRYHYVEFSQPYISSGLVMVVPVKPDKLKEKWMFMNAFSNTMWFLMTLIHLFVFPKLSPLAIDISKAIVEVNEKKQVELLDKQLLSSFNSNDGPIGYETFSGLFLISGLVCAVALLDTQVGINLIDICRI